MYRKLNEDELRFIKAEIKESATLLEQFSNVAIKNIDGDLIAFMVKAKNGEYCLLDGMNAAVAKHSKDIEEIEKYLDDAEVNFW